MLGIQTANHQPFTLYEAREFHSLILQSLSSRFWNPKERNKCACSDADSSPLRGRTISSPCLASLNRLKARGFLPVLAFMPQFQSSKQQLINARTLALFSQASSVVAMPGAAFLDVLSVHYWLARTERDIARHTSFRKGFAVKRRRRAIWGSRAEPTAAEQRSI